MWDISVQFCNDNVPVLKSKSICPVGQFRPCVAYVKPVIGRRPATVTQWTWTFVGLQIRQILAENMTRAYNCQWTGD